jgi:hypothetical protein
MIEKDYGREGRTKTVLPSEWSRKNQNTVSVYEVGIFMRIMGGMERLVTGSPGLRVRGGEERKEAGQWGGWRLNCYWQLRLVVCTQIKPLK